MEQKMNWEDIKRKLLEIAVSAKNWSAANPKKTIVLALLVIAFLAGALIF